MRQGPRQQIETVTWGHMKGLQRTLASNARRQVTFGASDSADLRPTMKWPKPIRWQSILRHRPCRFWENDGRDSTILTRLQILNHCNRRTRELMPPLVLQPILRGITLRTVRERDGPKCTLEGDAFKGGNGCIGVGGARCVKCGGDNYDRIISLKCVRFGSLLPCALGVAIDKGNCKRRYRALMAIRHAVRSSNWHRERLHYTRLSPGKPNCTTSARPEDRNRRQPPAG